MCVSHICSTFKLWAISNFYIYKEILKKYYAKN